MATFRVNFFFSQFKQGWTENWYIDQNTMSLAVAQASTLAPYLVAPRSIHTVLDSARVVQVNPPLPRKGTLVPLGLAGTRPDVLITLNPNEQEDIVQTCAFMAAVFNDGAKRSVMLRGLSDNDVTRDALSGKGTPSPPLVNTLNTLSSALAFNNWEMRHYSPVDVPFSVYKVDADPANAQFTRITGPGIPPFASLDTIHFTGVPLPTLPWLKGQWVVKAGTATSLSIGFVYPLGAPVLPLRMFAYESIYVYTNFVSWVFRDFRSRKTGRPTVLTRGRSAGVSYRR
jgi:hypothetical protein